MIIEQPPTTLSGQIEATRNDSNVMPIMEDHVVDTPVAQSVNSTEYKKLYFPVEEIPVFGMLGDQRIADPARKMIVRSDTNEVLAVQSMDYKLVTNEEVFTKFDQALLDSSLNTNNMKITEWSPKNGAQAVRKYEFPEHQVKIGEVDGKDDLLNMSLYVRNSYDSSSAFRAMLGAMRLLCWNGMVIGKKDLDLYGRHTKNLDIDKMIKKMDVAINMFTTQADEWRNWRTVLITEADARVLLDKASALSESAKEVIMLRYINETNELGNTIWALFQALTWWSTHSKLRANGGEATGDNIINVRLQREEMVRKLINNKHFLAAAA